ncbi:MAG: alpha/beta hydrolase family protein [Promethearchaeota archaeon]
MLKKKIIWKHHWFLISSIIFFIISVSSLFALRSESYIFYERIDFKSYNNTLYANLYHPTKKLHFQQKSPLIIFAHGLGGQRDLDPRVTNEFTKRGFYVASIDYRGEGESGGHILDINPNPYMNHTNIPAIAQDCSRLLDKLSQMSFFSKINISQIGLIGHSLGGMVALMNSALDDRFKATVTWAGLVNFSASFFGITEDHLFMNFIPVKIINESNPTNLLVIQSIYDTTVPFENNALVAKNLTNCKLLEIKKHLFGGPHYLFSDEVIRETIKWFELTFFHSETINGPIRLTYLINYILLGFSFIGLFLTTLSIIKFSFKYFSIKDYSKSDIKVKNRDKSKKYSNRKDIIKVCLCFIGFLTLWITMLKIIGVIGLLISPMIILLLYFLYIIMKYIITAEIKGEKITTYIELRLKDEIKSQFHKNVIFYSLFTSSVFLLLYLALSFSYPFAFFSPRNFLSYILTFSIYPFYLSMEIFYRKIIYPNLKFIKSASNRTIITSLMELINVVVLIYFSNTLFLISGMLVTYLMFLAVMVMNSIIYERTNKFSSVLISSFIIIQIFFGSVVSTILGFGSIVRLLHI